MHLTAEDMHPSTSNNLPIMHWVCMCMIHLRFLVALHMSCACSSVLDLPESTNYMFGAGSSAGESGSSAAALLRHRLLHNIRQDFIHHG